MPQKPSLAAALASAGGSTRRRVGGPLPSAMPGKRNDHPPAVTDHLPSESMTEGKQQHSRLGTKPVTAHLPGQVRSQLKILAAEKGSTLQDLMSEAFNDLFAKYGKPEIAPLKNAQ